MKCIPITLSGRLVAEAIFVMEIDEVFVARITPRRQGVELSKDFLFDLPVLGCRLNDQVGLAEGAHIDRGPYTV